MLAMFFRLFILIAYTLLSFIVSLFFIRSDGIGSHAPLAILFSWGILPGEYGLVSKMAGFWVLPIFYLLGLLGMTTVSVRLSRNSFSSVPFLIHGLGVIIALVSVTRHAEHGADATPGFMIASYITASLLATMYLIADWWLAQKDMKVTSDGILSCPKADEK